VVIAPLSSLALVGPRFEPAVAVGSYPLLPALDGRGWKYSGFVKFCPSNREPITWPFETIRLPLA
jgi:hypothetical protein